MLRVFEINEYVKPADRGNNRPIVLRGKTAHGEEASIFVKTRAGYGDRPNAPGIELFTSLLARELTLTAPEPVLVEIPAGFETVIHEAPEHRELVRLSPGTNFGTVALGTDWKTWPVDMSTRSFANDLIGNILAFDALTQHTDRESENPNMLWRHGEIAILDFEKCFGHLSTASDTQRPWRDFLMLNPLHRHCLRLAGKNLDDDSLGRMIWENLIELEMNERVPVFIDTAAGAFPESAVELKRVLRYFEMLGRNMPDFFDYFRLSVKR